MLTGLGLWSFKGDISSKRQAIGLYWQDVIWIIIFTVVYLFVYAPIINYLKIKYKICLLTLLIEYMADSQILGSPQKCASVANEHVTK